MMQNIKVIMSIPSALLLVVAVVEGYSRGAPKSRCDSMHPDHGHGLMAQPNSTNTFIISAGKLVNSTMDIVLNSKTGDTFKGFIIRGFKKSASDPEEEIPAGRFLDTNPEA